MSNMQANVGAVDSAKNTAEVKPSAPAKAKAKAPMFDGNAVTPTCILMVLLNMSNEPEQVEPKGDSIRLDFKTLSSFTTEVGTVLDIYNPFRKPSKGKASSDPDFKAGGILRDMLHNLIATLEDFNTTPVIITGDVSSRSAALKAFVQRVATLAEEKLPLKPDQVLWTAPDNNVAPLVFSDLVNVTTWQGKAGDGAISETPIVVTVRVTSGALQGTDNEAKMLRNIASFIETQISNIGAVKTPVYLGLHMGAGSLDHESMRSMLETLVSEDGFTVHGRSRLGRTDNPLWVPSSLDTVDKEVFTSAHADMVLARDFFPEVEDAEDDEGDGEE